MRTVLKQVNEEQSEIAILDFKFKLFKAVMEYRGILSAREMTQSVLETGTYMMLTGGKAEPDEIREIVDTYIEKVISDEDFIREKEINNQ